MNRQPLIQKFSWAAACAFLFLIFATPIVGAEPLDSLEVDEIQMVVGELETMKVYSLTRISITDPNVADVVEAGDDEILIVAKEAGQTTLFIWDDEGKRSLEIQVAGHTLGFIERRLIKLFDAVEIYEIDLDINEKEGKILLTGEIPEHKKEQFDQIVGPFDENLINLVKEEEVNDLIQIDMQITELSTTLTKAMGVDWTAGGSDGISFAYPETMPEFGNSIGDLFKIGDFQRTTSILATVNALIAEGEARVLSKPKLVVVSGEQASFLVGGEIPIRTTTTTGDSVQTNVEFKDYGVAMNITPTIKKEDKIDIILDVNVSDIDSSNAVGDDVAFTTQTANTHLYLDDQQTIVLAGLIKQNRAESITRIPFVSKIPVVGALFRNRSTPTFDKDQELVISLTPTIMGDKDGEDEQEVDEEEFIIEEIVTTMEKEASNIEETQEAEEVVSTEDEKIEAEIEKILEEEILPEDAALIDKADQIAEEAQSEELMELVAQKKEIEAMEQAASIGETGEGPIEGEESTKIEPYPTYIYVAPTIPRPKVEPEDTGPQDMNGYIQSIQKKISEAIIYPPEAREDGLEGTAKVNMLILNDGTLAFAMIKESSGHEVIDQYALDSARTNAPYSSFPANTDLKEINITIPIVYSLESN